MERKGGEEVHDKHVNHGGNQKAGGEDEDKARNRKENEKTKVGGAAKVTGKTVDYIKTEAAKRGCSKRPPLHQTVILRPQPCKPDGGEEETDGRGSVGVGAEDEVGAGAEEETSQGDWEVPAEGHVILEEIPAPTNSQNKKKMRAEGVGKSRDEKGLRSREMGGMQLWDPGSS